MTNMPIEDNFVEQFTYRGFTFDIFMDEPGQQFVTVWNGQEIGFGSFNTNYKEDIQYLVDDYLDTLYRFEDPYYGAKLELFENGDYQDVRLTYKRRMIKFWLIADKEKFSVEKLKAESLEILNKWTGR